MPVLIVTRGINDVSPIISAGLRNLQRLCYPGVCDMNVADSVKFRPDESIRAYLYAGNHVAPAVLPPVPFA